MTGLFLNIFECKFDKDYFDLQYLLYEKYATKEAYSKLRNENPDYEFYKYDVKLDSKTTERRIYFWSKKTSPTTTVTGIKEMVDIQGSPKVVSKIIEICILQEFIKCRRFKVYKKKEEYFWSIVSSKNLFTNINGLNAYNQVNFNTFFNSYNGTISFFFVLSRVFSISIACSESE